MPTPRVFNLPPLEFFEYWWALRKHDRHKRVTVYPYRKWPIVDVLLELLPDEQERVRRLRAQKKKAGPASNLGIETTGEPFDPKNWESEIYHRYGAGDYHFKLNDTNPKVNKTICMTMVRGLRDLDNFPPMVRPTIVVLTDPANESYLQWARARGIHFPGDPAFQRPEEEDMAAVAAAAEQKSSEILATTLGRVVDNIQSKANAPSQDQGLVTVFGQMLDVLQKQQTAQMDAILRRLEAQEKAPAVAPQNPVDMVTPLVALAKTIANPGGDSPQKENPMIAILMEQNRASESRWQEFMKQQGENHKESMGMLNKRLESAESTVKELLTKKPDENQVTGVAPFMTFLKGFANMRDLLEKATGSGAAAEEAGPWWVGPAERLVENVVDGVKAYAGMQGGIPPLPQQMPQSVPGLPPAPQQVQQPKTQEEQVILLEKMAAQRIHPDLVQALEARQKGYEFAGRLFAAFGNDPQFAAVYNGVLQKGPAGVIGDGGFLRHNANLWGELLALNSRLGGNALEQFVVEFLDVQKARQVAEQIIAAQQQQVATPAPAAPVAKPVNVTPAPAIDISTGSTAPKKGRVVIGPDGPIQTA